MSDLTDRMRTCAAAIASRRRDALLPENMLNDAADLLLEASNALEAIPEPLGEPMEILKALPATATSASIDPPEKLVEQYKTVATWFSGHDTLPPARRAKSPNGRACPQCDSRAHKRVFRNGTALFLACPVCATTWEYKP